jgi:ribonuclease BN (tRNA processing enzyme)
VPSRLVVLGSCGAWPEPGRACSGFVVEHQGFRVVLDLGYGTFSRLAGWVGSTVADGVDAVVVTHGHPDHMVDLHALFRARWFGRRGAPAVPVFAAEGVLERLTCLEDDDVDDITAVFHMHPLPADPYDVGPLQPQQLAAASFRAQRRRTAVLGKPHRRLHRRHRTRSELGAARP